MHALRALKAPQFPVRPEMQAILLVSGVPMSFD